MDTIISVRKKGTTPVFVNYIQVLIQEYGHNYIKNKWPANPYKIKHALPIGNSLTTFKSVHGYSSINIYCKERIHIRKEIVNVKICICTCTHFIWYERSLSLLSFGL